MVDRVGSARVDIDADTKAADAKIKSFAKRFEDYGKRLQKVGRNLSRSLSLPAGALGVLSVRNFGVEERALTSLTRVMTNLGRATDGTLERLKKFADARQRVTRFGNEQTLQLAAQIAAFSPNLLPQAEQIITSIQDYAELRGRDPLRTGRSIIPALGRVAAGRPEGLTTLETLIDFGVKERDKIQSLLESGAGTDALARVLEAMVGAAGGLAEEIGSLDTSKITRTANDFGDATEAVGMHVASTLAPAMVAASDAFISITGKLVDSDNKLGKGVGYGVVIAAAVGPLVTGLAGAVATVAAFTAAVSSIRLGQRVMDLGKHIKGSGVVGDLSGGGAKTAPSGVPPPVARPGFFTRWGNRFFNVLVTYGLYDYALGEIEKAQKIDDASAELLRKIYERRAEEYENAFDRLRRGFPTPEGGFTYQDPESDLETTLPLDELKRTAPPTTPEKRFRLRSPLERLSYRPRDYYLDSYQPRDAEIDEVERELSERWRIAGEKLATTIEDSFRVAFNNAIDGFARVKDESRNFARRIIADLAAQLIGAGVQSLFTGAGAGSSAGSVPAGFGRHSGTGIHSPGGAGGATVASTNIFLTQPGIHNQNRVNANLNAGRIVRSAFGSPLSVTV